MLKPLTSDRWNYALAAHLLNRAGFGGPPQDVQKLADLGPDKAVSYLLDYELIPDPTPNPDWAHPDPEEILQFRQGIKNAATPEAKKQLQQQQQQMIQQRMMELRGWWLQRMVRGPRPFQEKMVLFWHGHFATSYEKVRNPYYMWRQNELFRRLATGNWELLLGEAGKDPAMLVWLDQAQSRKEHPNENYARENMELFALGEGHYTEKDVTECARALTGWSLMPDEQKFIYRPFFHDNTMKTILGRVGNFDGDDVIKIVVSQPQAAKFITAKLWNFFAGQEPDEAMNNALAAVFRENNNDFKPMLRAMFRSEEFYGSNIVRNAVKSPVQWLVGSVRMLECDLPPTVASYGMLRQLGQDLFAPPNVKGWDGGITWITTNTLLTRYNDAQSLIDGSIPPLSATDLAKKPGGAGGMKLEKVLQRERMGGVDVKKILPPEERDDNKSIIASLQRRLFQTTLHQDQQEALQEFLDSKTKMSDADIATAIRLMMSTPDYQVT